MRERWKGNSIKKAEDEKTWEKAQRLTRPITEVKRSFVAPAGRREERWESIAAPDSPRSARRWRGRKRVQAGIWRGRRDGEGLSSTRGEAGIWKDDAACRREAVLVQLATLSGHRPPALSRVQVEKRG
jgi:hypothetical protein